MKNIPLDPEDRARQKEIRKKVAEGDSLEPLMKEDSGHDLEKETVELMGDVVSFPHEEEPEEKKEPEEQVPPQSVFGRTMGVIYSPKILRPLSNLLKMIHVVQDGDTLSSIARKYGTTVEKLKKLNHLTDEQAGQLKTGQKIRYK